MDDDLQELIHDANLSGEELHGLIERIQDEDGFLDYQHLTGELKRAIEGDIDAANNNELATASSPTAQNRRAKADLEKKLLETEAKTERLAQELNAAAQREIGLLEELAICRSENTCVAARERAAQNATLELRKQLALMKSKPLVSSSCTEGESHVALLLMQLELTEAKAKDLGRRLGRAEALLRTRVCHKRDCWEDGIHIKDGDDVLMDPKFMFDHNFKLMVRRRKQGAEEMRRKDIEILRRCETVFELLHA